MLLFRAQTHQCIFSLHVLARKLLAILINKLKRPSNLWSAHTLCLFGNALAFHTFLFVAEVDDEARAHGEEEDCGC